METKNPEIKMTETELRELQVMEWVVRSWPRHRIVQEGVKLWNVSDRMIDSYTRNAKLRVRELKLAELEDLMTESYAYWQDFIYRCQVANDRQNEMLGRKHLEKLMGIDPTTGNETGLGVPTEIKLVEKK